MVNVQKAMLESDELKKISAEMEAKYKPRQDELNKLQNDLQSIQQQLQSGKLTPQAQADLQVQGQRKQRDASGCPTICSRSSTATARTSSARRRRRCRK